MFRAALELHDVVAHQGNVGPSSVPSAAFLAERLPHVDVDAKEELIMALHSFSKLCVAMLMDNAAKLPAAYADWVPQLFAELNKCRDAIESALESTNSDIAEYARCILDNLNNVAECGG